MSLVIITPENFLKALYGKQAVDVTNNKIKFLDDKGVVVINSVLVKEPIYIHKHKEFKNRIVIKNSKFESDFVVENAHFHESILLSNIQCEKQFKIEGGTFHNRIELQENQFNNGVDILGTQFNGAFIISGGEFGPKNIKYDEPSIYFSRGNGSKKSLFIDEAKFKCHFIIEKDEFLSHFLVNNTSFGSNFIIQGGNFHKRSGILKGSFHEGALIDGGDDSKPFIIYDGVFKNGFTIEDSYFDRRVHISGGVYLDSFNIIGGNFFEYIEVDGGDFKDLFSISGSRIVELVLLKFSVTSLLMFNCHIEILDLNLKVVNHSTLKEVYVNKAYLFGVLSKNAEICFKYFSCNSLSLSLTNLGLISIEKLKFRNTSFRNIRDSSNLKEPIFNLEEDTGHIESSLRLEGNLGNIFFINTNFHSADKIIIEGCFLNNIKTFNGHIPLALKSSSVFTDEDSNQNAFVLEEVYNQLYNAMKNNGNRTWELRYNSEYMEWHKRSLKLKNEEPFTRLTILINKITTDYGKNWFRSLIITIVLGLLFYNLYYISIWGIQYNFKYVSWGTLLFHLGNYIEFMLPTHKFNFIENVKPGSSSLLIDSLGRILIGFMIYQTISSFRSFARKS